MILNGPFAARAPIVPQLFRKEKQGLDRLTDTSDFNGSHWWRMSLNISHTPH